MRLIEGALEWKRLLILRIVADVLYFPDVLVEQLEELAAPALTNEIKRFTNIVIEEQEVVVPELRAKYFEMVELR